MTDTRLSAWVSFAPPSSTDFIRLDPDLEQNHSPGARLACTVDKHDLKGSLRSVSSSELTVWHWQELWLPLSQRVLTEADVDMEPKGGGLGGSGGGTGLALQFPVLLCCFPYSGCLYPIGFTEAVHQDPYLSWTRGKGPRTLTRSWRWLCKQADSAGASALTGAPVSFW